MDGKLSNQFNLDSQNLNYSQKKLKLEIYSAHPLDQKYVDEIVDILTKRYNFVAKPLIVGVDEKLIGGVKVIFDSKVIDGTFKGRLDNIRANISKKGIA